MVSKSLRTVGFSSSKAAGVLFFTFPPQGEVPSGSELTLIRGMKWERHGDSSSSPCSHPGFLRSTGLLLPPCCSAMLSFSYFGQNVVFCLSCFSGSEGRGAGRALLGASSGPSC